MDFTNRIQGNTMAEQPNGLLLCDDLIFTSRIDGTARALNLPLQTAQNLPALQRLAEQCTPTGVILDLGLAGSCIEEVLSGLRKACPMMPRVVAYGSHVDTTTLKRARTAGCDVVLPRSQFVEELPTRLAEWLQPRGEAVASPAAAEDLNPR